MSFELFITIYGYPALFVCALIEGETPVVIAGFLAHRGYLYLPLVEAVVFLGAFCSDQFWFHLGRHGGAPFVQRHKRWQVPLQRLHRLLERHPVAAVFGFRFMYGFRIIAPVVLGMSRLSPWRFLFLNALGVALWTLVISSVGYLFGRIAGLFLGHVRQYERWILAGMAVTGLVVWLVYRIRRRRLAAALAAQLKNAP